MKTLILISFLLLLITACNTNEPEEIYLAMGNLNITAIANSIPNTDSILVSVDFSFEYEFINCRGMIEHYTYNYPNGTGHGGPVEALTSKGKNAWTDYYEIKLKKSIPNKFNFGVNFQGRIYKDTGRNYEEFSKTIEKEVIIRKDY